MPLFPDASLVDLRRDVARIAAFVGRTEADARVVGAGSRSAFALFGRRRLRVPEDMSLVCGDADPSFIWCTLSPRIGGQPLTGRVPIISSPARPYRHRRTPLWSRFASCRPCPC